MKQTLLKSWKTTAFGVLMLGYLAWKLFSGDLVLDQSTIMNLLIGMGFLASKDGNASHTKN